MIQNNLEQEINCNSSAGQIIFDGFLPLYNYKSDVHKKFEVINKNYVRHCLDLDFTLPVTGSINDDAIFLKSGEYILRMYSCLYENSWIISGLGNTIGQNIREFRQLYNSLTINLATNYNSGIKIQIF